MLRNNDDELPYFDETGNQYVREIKSQDDYVRRGGKLSASEMIKYENRVAMLAERLVLILEAIREDADAVNDYLQSIEQNNRRGLLPRPVYSRFREKIGDEKGTSILSERERDRQRFIRGETGQKETNLSELSVDELLELHRQQQISTPTLFHQFKVRERAGEKIQKIDGNLWRKYRSWVGARRGKPRRFQN